ncbi:hypothetical protein KP509_34G066600 [Ceratopteris richardii]|uniref:CCHC-type domain-containing protein n=1 Tax=Ceratopteris richardii TaxID=49495 RepID=A0A8T2QM88_CERRI|nr:hypothetical protein KP509_34G066600 [Ceratopteris richardii]
MITIHIEPPVPRWGPRPTYAYGGQSQVGGYQRPEPQNQRRTGPPECWRCGCLGHIQAHCPNARKQEDFTPMCRYCSREGHYDSQPQQAMQPPGRVPNTGVVIRELHPRASTSTHLVEADQGKGKGKEPMVAVVTRAQEYTRANQVQVNDDDETHRQRDLDGEDEVEVLPPITRKFVSGVPPFPERLKVQEKLPIKKQTEAGMDIVQRLAETEVTLDLATLLRCSPTCRKQFYNEFIKKTRKVKRKEKVDEVVLGTIQSITTQVDSNAPVVTVEINGYAVPGAQLDSGAAVNLMIECMMKALGSTQLEDTPMSLQMADQTQVKPAGLIQKVPTIIGGIEFSVDYLVLRPRSIETTFSILLGRPWLMQAECVHDWRTGLIAIGPKNDRIQIRVTPKEDVKKTVPIKEREKKVVEKDVREKVREKCSLKAENYKSLLQDGFNLQATRRGQPKMGEYVLLTLYNDDSDRELLGFLGGFNEFECYTTSMDSEGKKMKGAQGSFEEVKSQSAMQRKVKKLGTEVVTFRTKVPRKCQEPVEVRDNETYVSEVVEEMKPKNASLKDRRGVSGLVIRDVCTLESKCMDQKTSTMDYDEKMELEKERLIQLGAKEEKWCDEEQLFTSCDESLVVVAGEPQVQVSEENYEKGLGKESGKDEPRRRSSMNGREKHERGQSDHDGEDTMDKSIQSMHEEKTSRSQIDEGHARTSDSTVKDEARTKDAARYCTRSKETVVFVLRLLQKRCQQKRSERVRLKSSKDGT